MEAGYSRNGAFFVAAISYSFHLTDINLVHARSRLKKASHHLCGDHHLPAAAIPLLYAKLSQSRRAVTAFPISTQALLRLASRHPAKALRTRLAADAQAPYLHDSLPLAPPMVRVARSHHLVLQARRTLHQAACMAHQPRIISSSKLQPAPPAARHYSQD
jgi:hypothetical protein